LDPKSLTGIVSIEKVKSRDSIDLIIAFGGQAIRSDIYERAKTFPNLGDPDFFELHLVHRLWADCLEFGQWLLSFPLP
jgi:hypothetical protein